MQQQTFLDWLCQPEPRTPPTQKQLAEELGLSEGTLSRWRSLPGFSAATLETKRSFVSTDDILQVIDAMVREAVGGNVTAAKLVMEYVGLLDPEAQADRRYQEMTLKIDGEEITIQLRQAQQRGGAA